MKFKKIVLIPFALFALAFVMSSLNNNRSSLSPYEDEEANKMASLAAFDTILTVLKSPRCMNCHPVLDQPRQTDEQYLHLFNVRRGDQDKGVEVQKCATCHHEENNEYTNVPGTKHWQLAPKSMGWFGLSDLELGEALIDTKKNGNRSAEDLVEHMSNDPLVLWAWNPGAGRTTPSIEFDDFKKALNNWLDHGAYIPEK